ncbi:hypothetical protein BGZ96_012532 [Linnemannia gamsii]|uniref:Uncharacterized protein n=1 Tax=Linnemannia gamsii TaxID=64522 RepID=A0ABQ7JQ80_9FUNG|nr:hypothetical protein BGZ96_012532 [Linnemannia gamsii]
MNKTRQAAQEFVKKGLPLHILVNNSGIAGGPLGLSVDGIESEFAVNHMGHFVLTTALLDRIKESQPSRIVVMSTSLHENASGINYDTIYKTGDTSQPHHQSAWDRFYRSKLANIMFAKALARRLGTESGVYVNCANPGYVSTESTQPVNGGGMLDGLKDWAHSLVTYPVERGALTPLYLATSREVEEMKITGRYFGPVANELEPSNYARDEKLQEELWAYSEKMANEKLKA